jgi:hypothetical protein
MSNFVIFIVFLSVFVIIMFMYLLRIKDGNDIFYRIFNKRKIYFSFKGRT